ncbi:MAG: RNA methyltransferase [Candidatus Cloacimonadaceae bacterium]|nr:RNA methyltransferase [Candidatus Cloacimonadaceae bacterium]
MDAIELSKARLKELAKLKQKKYREVEQRVVVEGKRTIMQLLDMGVKPLEIYIAEGTETPVTDPNVPVYILNQHDLTRLCDTIHPQTIAALYDIPQGGSFDFHVAFYLDGINDPGNLGTIFRVASAFGIDGIMLSPDCCEAMSPKTIRASLGAVFQVPWAIVSHHELRSNSAGLVYADMHGKTAMQDFRVPQEGALILAIGSEAQGLSQEIKALAIHSLRIGMKSGMESLNAAVAAGIIAHHIWQQINS